MTATPAFANLSFASTGPSWTTIYTGQSWEVHRVHDRWAREIVGTHIFSQVSLPFFWDWMNAAGLSTGLLNLPVTYPPRPVDGYMVSGFPAPNGASITAPLGLPLPPDYVVDYVNLLPDDVRHPDEWYRAEPLAEVFATIARLDVHKIYALKSLPVLDVMAVQFPVIDRVGHILEMVGIDAGTLPGKSNLVWEDAPPPAQTVSPISRNMGEYTPNEAGQIEEQLKALGYVD